MSIYDHVPPVYIEYALFDKIIFLSLPTAEICKFADGLFVHIQTLPIPLPFKATEQFHC